MQKTFGHIFIFQPSIKFIRKNVKEFIPTMDSSLAFSLMKLLDCFFTPFVPVEVSLDFYDEVIFENLLKALLSHDLDFL